MDNKELIKQGLELLLKKIFDAPVAGYGLCEYIYDVSLDEYGKIPLYLKGLIYTYIQNNRPTKWYQRFYSHKFRNKQYFWDAWDKQIRVNFLKYHIKKLSK